MRAIHKSGIKSLYETYFCPNHRNIDIHVNTLIEVEFIKLGLGLKRGVKLLVLDVVTVIILYHMVRRGVDLV